MKNVFLKLLTIFKKFEMINDSIFGSAKIKNTDNQSQIHPLNLLIFIKLTS